MKIKLLYLILCAVPFLFFACGEESYRPKPRAYHRIELPSHEYKILEGDYPYVFKHSKHAVILKDTSLRTEPYWIVVDYPTMKAQISITYKPIDNNFDSLVGFSITSHKLTNKHQVKASSIDEALTRTQTGYLGVLFELEGDVPSQFQWYVTDSTNNFLRAALYFPYSTKNDSLAPVIQYIKKDMMEMFNSVEWKTKKSK